MPLYHGTSASAALKIINNNIGPSDNGFLYCFASQKPESRAGALCFATGGDLRRGVIDTSKLLSQYFTLNPDFPKGLKGVFCKAALRLAISSWQKKQRELASPPHADRAAIVVFRDHPEAVDINRGGFINEVKVPATALSSLVIEKVYIDDTLLTVPDIMQAQKSGVVIEPLSTWAQMIDHQVVGMKAAKKSGYRNGLT